MLYPKLGRTRRVLFLDELRGVCLILMILYHAAYDLNFLFGVDLPFYSAPFAAVQLFICCNFIFISGISSRFSRNNLKRGLVVFAIAMAMTAVTYFFMPQQTVRFGVLHLLGVCMILHGVIYSPKGVTKRSPLLGLLVCLLVFAFTWGVSRHYVGFLGLYQIPLPSVLYTQYFLFPLGFPTPDFASSDYFPLLPWMFLFFAGSFLGVAFREGNAPGFFYRSRSRTLQWMGRRTLPIYVLHQPVLYGILYLFFLGLEKAGLR
ncbi:DUF1624 domain-containing protein [Ruminococcaceae bacterium OttesenSCG-928-L11]|nr:DUF1624 domain-containing protein [Ruminococcaceae bacterium OttesenSCG-928-L11]